MKKAIAIVASVAALAYVGLAFAATESNGGEGQKNDLEQRREQRKTEFEQQREQLKTEWQQSREQWKTEREQALEKFKQEKENLVQTMKYKFTQNKCANIEAKIQERTSNFENAKEKHATVYTNLLDRIDKFIARFDAFNADPANTTKIDPAKIQKLKDDRAHLADLTASFKTSFADYFIKLNGTKNFTCGHSEGEFRSSLVDAKTYLASVHENASAIRTYVRETILPDLLAIKKEVAQIKGDAGDGNDSQKNTDENKSESGDQSDSGTTSGSTDTSNSQ